MEIQTMSFSVRGMTDRQAFHYVESLRLGISEYDGLVRHARARRAVAGEWIVFFAWRDEYSLRAFRRSELYAKLALSPNVTDFSDTIETVVEASVTEDMIALAA